LSSVHDKIIKRWVGK